MSCRRSHTVGRCGARTRLREETARIACKGARGRQKVGRGLWARQMRVWPSWREARLPASWPRGYERCGAGPARGAKQGRQLGAARGGGEGGQVAASPRTIRFGRIRARAQRDNSRQIGSGFAIGVGGPGATGQGSNRDLHAGKPVAQVQHEERFMPHACSAAQQDTARKGCWSAARGRDAVHKAAKRGVAAGASSGCGPGYTGHCSGHCGPTGGMQQRSG